MIEGKKIKERAKYAKNEEKIKLINKIQAYLFLFYLYILSIISN
jgi:hypothetical protein